MNANLYALLLAVILAAVSQILLKISADKHEERIILEYFNIKTGIGYTLLFLSSLLVIFALQKIPYKDVAIINSLTQVLVTGLAWRVLGEKVTRFNLFGVFLVILGTYTFFL